MENQLQKVIGVLDPERQEALAAKFNQVLADITPIVEKAKSIIVTDESQKELIAQAKSGRLFLKNKRVEVEKTRKELKEKSLREGQAIDAVAKIIREMIEPAEQHLEEQEKFAERQAAQRREELREKRHEEMLEYTSDPSLFDLGNMSEEQYRQLYEGQKAAHEARVKAEAEAEAARLAAEKAAEEERLRISADNERLRKEAEERERQLAEERAKAEAERKRLEAIARKEAEERERLENEKRAEEARKAAEEKARIEAEKKAARAPDKTKLTTLANLISSIEMPEVKSEEAAAIIAEVRSLLAKVSNHITEKVNKL